ncbi:MAG: DUF523 domain-containing protein [Acholeplasmatales bacterium]|nr:DUF523 domain-containing protein [Acholeplasmatales bacterium]
MIAVSKCLCGYNCKYNGENNLRDYLKKLEDNNEVLLICPEVFGGLPIPRIPFELKNGRAINKDGVDVTDKVIDGCNKALKLIKENNITKVILKENSPTCGVNYIYDGTFTHTKIKGCGLLTKMLKDENIKVYSDEEFYEEK